MKALKIVSGLKMGVAEIIDLPDKDYIEDIYAHLDCRIFDIVTIEINGKYYSMFVDDEGLLKDKPEANYPAWYWYSKFNPMAPIVGNVIITSMTEDGDTKGLFYEEADDLSFTVTLLMSMIMLSDEPIDSLD